MLFDRLTGKSFDDLVGVAQFLCCKINLIAVIFLELFFHSDKVKEFVEEPLVYHGYPVYLLNAHTTAQRFVNNE